MWNLSPEEWNQFYREARERVVKLGPDEQVAELKRYHADRENEVKRLELATFLSQRRAELMGLAYNADRRGHLFTEEKAKLEGTSRKKLEAALAEAKAWEEKGKWQDAKYVRNFLVFEGIDDVLGQRAEATETVEQAEAVWETSPSQWQQLWDDADSVVDGLGAEEQVAEAKRAQAENDREEAEALAAFAEYQDSSATSKFLSKTPSILEHIIEGMKNPFDLLFLGLAIFSAYGIASGSSSEEE